MLITALMRLQGECRRLEKLESGGGAGTCQLVVWDGRHFLHEWRREHNCLACCAKLAGGNRSLEEVGCGGQREEVV